MKKRQIVVLFAPVFVLVNLNAALPANSLEVFLHSQDLSERRAAYLDILNNREKYINQIEQGLVTFARAKEKNIGILERYIYLAAMIRSEKFIPSLVAIFKDYGDLGGSCVYCCPIVFAMTLYGAFSNWSPPEMMEESETYMVDDLRTGIRKIVGWKNTPLVWERLKVEFADPEKQKWFERIELLSVEELIKMTGPENADSNERYWAAQALTGKVIDEKNLKDLYWLAIEELPRDASGFYRCCTYEAIERAEIAKVQREMKQARDLSPRI